VTSAGLHVQIRDEQGRETYLADVARGGGSGSGWHKGFSLWFWLTEGTPPSHLSISTCLCCSHAHPARTGSGGMASKSICFLSAPSLLLVLGPFIRRNLHASDPNRHARSLLKSLHAIGAMMM